jgi:prepilin-type N-terminal cleavage/methylation domain-containing protein
MRKESFTLIELVVVIAIMGVLMAFVLPSIGSVMERSRKSASQNCMRQIANAYIMYRESNGSFVKSDGGVINNLSDFALALAQEGLLNDPNCYVFPSDALARSTNKVKKNTIVHGDGKEFTKCWTNANADNNFSIFIIIDLPDSCQPNTTPIAYTRGLKEGENGGDWDDANGVFGSKGGFIAFLDGKVKWFDDVKGKLMKADMTSTTNDIKATLPAGYKILRGGGVN